MNGAGAGKGHGTGYGAGAKSPRTRKTAITPAVRGCRAIILGIDPSLRGTGLAVIDARSEPMRLLASVTLKLSPKLEAYECLGRIADAVEKLVREHTVTHASIEETIYVPNFRTAQAMGASRGAALSVLAAAVPVFHDKQPDADLAQFHVHVHPAADGTFQVVFEPRQDRDAAPTLGGRTSHGRELNVWIKAADNTLERIAFAR